MPPITVTSEPPYPSLSRQMSKLVEQMQKGYYNFCPDQTWTPAVNLYETDASYLVCVDLAGVDKDKIDLEVHDQRLTLRGSRAVPLETSPTEPAPAGRIRVHLMEIDHGAFCREVELPLDVERDKIIASHRNGLLWIELPKK